MGNDPSLNDPNVQIVTTSSKFDPGVKVKMWVDKRAVDPANTSEYFEYTVLVRSGMVDKVIAKPFTLSRFEAANANCPAAGAKVDPDNVWPVPHRKLLPEETATIDPFGTLRVKEGTVGEKEISMYDLLQRVEGKVDKILEKLDDN